MQLNLFQSTPSAWRVTPSMVIVGQIGLFQSTPSAWRVTAKAHKKSRTLLFKVTDLRRNCRPDVHERTEGSLWQAVFAG